MAGQEIIFQFLSRGSAQLAGDFRKVGDDAALSSRGVQVLQDVITRLGDKEDRTAAESKLLAKALRETGDAADRAAAKAVLADAAIGRLGEQMKQAETKSSGLNKALGDLKPNPGLAGPLVALIPALGTLTGVVAGAGAGLAGAFVAGGAALGAFGAVAKPVLTDALTASKAVNTAQNTYQATLKAGVPTAQAQATLQAANARAVLTYNAAIAGGANPAKALAAEHLTLAKNQLAYNTATNAGTFNAKAYAAEQKAIGKAYADLSPQQIALSKQLGAMANAWDAVKTAQTPVVAGALQPWLKSVTDLTKNLGPIIAAVAPVIKDLGGQFDALINSAAFKGFRDFIAGTGTAAVSATGSTLIDLIKGFIILLPKFDPLIREAVGWISRLGPAFATWAASKKSSDDIQAFIRFFSANGAVVGDLLKNIGLALKALAPGLTSGGAVELRIISDFFGLVAKLPASFAKPLTEVAGTLLVLSKLGVLKVGVQVIGAAAKWLTGGVVNLGGGAAAGAEIRAAMVSGGAAAAAEIRAAMAGGGAAAGAESGAGAAGAAGGKAAGGGFLAGFSAIVGPAIGGVMAGLLIKAVGDTLSPKGTFAGRLNAQMQQLGQTSGGIFSTNLLHSFTFGGLEAWLTAKIGLPVGNVLNNIAAGAKTWGAGLASGVTGTFSNIAGGAKTWWGNVTGTVSGAWRTITGASSTGSAAVVRAFGAAGAAADALRTRNLIPLQGAAATVSGGIQGLAGMITGRGVPALSSMGTAATSVRTGSLVPLGVGVDTTAGKVGNLSKYLLAVPKNVKSTVAVNFVGSGSGSIAFKESIPGVTVGPSSTGLLGFHAAGGLVRGGVPGRDSVLGWLMPDEVIVPAAMVRAGAVDHLRGKLPGFAAGGIVSDYAGMLKAGQPFMSNTETGFGRAVEDAFAKAVIAKFKKDLAAAQAAGSSVPGGGGGAARWKNQILTALAMLRQPGSLLGAVEHRMNQESGGNQFAVNKWDSNWLRGTPSVGVMQVIGPTYASNSPPGWRNLPPMAYGVSEDVLANTYAGLHHAITAYPGRSLASVMLQSGGYASGTASALPGWAWVGERGPELVNFRGGEQVTPGGGFDGLAGELRALRAEVRQLTGVAAGIPAATGRHVGGAINSSAGAAGFRRRYPQGGA